MQNEQKYLENSKPETTKNLKSPGVSFLNNRLASLAARPKLQFYNFVFTADKNENLLSEGNENSPTNLISRKAVIVSPIDENPVDPNKLIRFLLLLSLIKHLRAKIFMTITSLLSLA
jgi:hypothetical protein